MTFADTAMKVYTDVRTLALGPQGKSVLASRHWRLVQDSNQIVWLLFDFYGSETNRVSNAVLADLDLCLGKIEAIRPAGLVLRSAKKSGFAEGLDIAELRNLEGTAEIEAVMTRGHEVLDRLAALQMPTVAVVHGHCLGAGLEIALACKSRIAIEGTMLGFPDIHLGLHPGLGGTVRLPAVVGTSEALTMMIEGEVMTARAALDAGLVDAVIEERHVENAISAVVSEDGARHPRRAQQTALFPGMRTLTAHRMRSRLNAGKPEMSYPAPHSLVDLWQSRSSRQKNMQKVEIQSFARLLNGSTARNLIRNSLLRDGLVQRGKGSSGIQRVHVIGAGTVGGDIAALCAARGYDVTLNDQNPQAIAKAIGRASRYFENTFSERGQREKSFDRLMADFSGSGLAKADLVIEALPEDLETKKAVLQSVVPGMKQSALVATTTAGIPLELLSEGLPRANRLVGIHFLVPVLQTELTEIIVHKRASFEALEIAQAFCGSLDRLPVQVKSSPGFLINRVFMPYFLEAMIMQEHGISRELIDNAAREFGMTMGPIEFADWIGIDVCLEAIRAMGEGHPSISQVPAALAEMVSRGETGMAAGQGFYHYDKTAEPVRKKATTNANPAIIDRLILPMVNACVACLREGVVADEEILDIAVVSGLGFAPFRGGPLHYARASGLAAVISELERLQHKYGDRFAPDPGWIRLGIGGSRPQDLLLLEPESISTLFLPIKTEDAGGSNARKIESSAKGSGSGTRSKTRGTRKVKAERRVAGDV